MNRKNGVNGYFFDSSNRVLLKDRGETLYSNCWEAYQSEQNRAESKASLAMLGCLCLIESGPELVYVL